MARLYILTDILKTEISSDKTKRLLKYTSITYIEENEQNEEIKMIKYLKFYWSSTALRHKIKGNSWTLQTLTQSQCQHYHSMLAANTIHRYMDFLLAMKLNEELIWIPINKHGYNYIDKPPHGSSLDTNIRLSPLAARCSTSLN